MKVAIYCRVSTEEQNVDMQLFACMNYIKEKNLTVIKQYKDFGSGRTFERKEYQQMMKDAVYRKFDALIVYKMDRLSRGKIIDVLGALEKLKSFGITVVSVTEPFLNTDNPSSDLILAVMSWCANMESKRIGERVSSGIKSWQKNTGKRWHSKDWDIVKAIELRQQGIGWRTIEKELRKLGYDVTYAGIRKELLNRGVNLLSKNCNKTNTTKSVG